jgi:hypothetical protein
LAGATVVVLSQTANSATFAPEIMDGAYHALNALNVSAETAQPILIEQMSPSGLRLTEESV